MKIKHNKRAQQAAGIGAGIGFAILLIIFGVYLAIGGAINEEVLEHNRDRAGTADIINETLSLSNNTNDATATAPIESIIVIVNATDGGQVMNQTTDWNVTLATGTINASGFYHSGAQNYNISYRVQTKCMGENITLEALEGVESFAGFQSVIAITLITVLLIGMIVLLLRR
jgi:hypothetical protein